MTNMIKSLLLTSVLFLFVACGGDNQGELAKDNEGGSSSLTVCDCLDASLNMTKDLLRGMSEEDAKIKYAKKEKECIDLEAGKSNQELSLLEEEAKKCSSFKEFEKIQIQLMEKAMFSLKKD